MSASLTDDRPSHRTCRTRSAARALRRTRAPPHAAHGCTSEARAALAHRPFGPTRLAPPHDAPGLVPTPRPRSGGGTLDESELKYLLNDLGAKEIGKKEAANWMKRLDKDRSGSIGKGELLDAILTFIQVCQ